MISSRRSFVKNIALAGTALPLLHVPFGAKASNLFQGADGASFEETLEINIFSKHLQFLDYTQTGEIAAELGFDGVDLTVRPKGHVLPETVKEDLPKAINGISQGGSNCSLITTSIESVSNPLDVNIIETAAKSGIKYYRTHWFKYIKDRSMTDSLAIYQDEIKKLGDFNKENDIIGCYQNHAGTDIGSSFWEIHQILQTVDKQYFGTEYDIRHATAEGGYSWVNGFELLREQIKVIVLKDFKWARVDGKWTALNVPIGEGMVDFTRFFQLLKKYQINVPVSLHLEYPLGGAEKGNYSITVDKKIVFESMKKDLDMIRKLWEKA